VNYIFDNAAVDPSAQRFNSLEALHDERSIRYLERTGIGTGWHCLEVGGGAGSIANWLADRVGGTGSVVVTDIDPRFLNRSPRPNIEIRRHNIAADPLPNDTFDLIHARLVFVHVVDPWCAINRLIAALKPGGWLVVEDYDPSLLDRGLPCFDEAAAGLTVKVFRAMQALMQARGLDIEFARNLYARFIAIGLTAVGMEGHVAARPGGSDGARLDLANLSQVRDEAIAHGLLTVDEADRMATLLQSPEFAVLSPVMFSAWGRRPLQPS
jgi:ubiquinone/menaquinone biosynthesis C-methylase UbiE